jgi:Domain of unknown function (DUF1844)
MAEDEKPIRVVDRRMFTPDGDLRPDFQSDESAPGSAADASAAAAAAAPRPAEPPETARKAEAPRPEPAEASAAEPRGAFALIVQILAMPAYAALGLVPDPASGRRRVDRAAAREMIDLLVALERKTQGNLSFEESTFLSRVLTELRLAFVEVTRPPAK